MDTKATLDMVREAIAPFVGPVMAEASVTLQAKKLGVTDGALSQVQLQSLVESIRRAMTVFVGDEKAKEIETEIWKRVKDDRVEDR